MSEKIKVVLPEKYDLVVGDTFQLFYKGVVMAPNPYVYDIVSVCETGKNYPRYFELLPENPGKVKLTIYVYNAERELVGSGETILDIAQAKKPERKINVLCVGDSLTSGGYWVEECNRRLTGTGGVPSGHGFDNIYFVGGCRYKNSSYEGYGGWHWNTYACTAVGGIWVTCNHNKDASDQHSVWTDDKGNQWKLETIEESCLKFLRCNSCARQKPDAGKLCHFSNAVNKEDIQIISTRYEKDSPFCNHDTGKIDFPTYCTRNGIDKIDVIYIMLGANGVTDVSNPAVTMCPKVIAMAKTFIDIIHAQLPGTKVKLMGIPVPSQNGGMGASYGAVLPYCDKYGYTTYVLELNRQYEAFTKEEKYRDFMEFINVSGQFDSENGYPVAEKSVNTRSTKTELVGTNGLHPTYEGYMQVADAVYRNLVHFCAEN